MLLHKNAISPQMLDIALEHQRLSQTPLGEVLISMGLISKPQLRTALVRQRVMRCLAAGLLFILSFSDGNSYKKARADMVKDIPAQVTLASAASPRFTDVVVHPKIFDTAEKKSSNIEPFTKWTEMFDRFEVGLEDDHNRHVLKQWTNRLKTYEHLSLPVMVRKVNTFVNETRYIQDKKNWGRSDYWATPVEFLERGGDCEDFAIAKYTALRALGVPESRLRLAVVHDTLKDMPHAVLIVYGNGGAYILDNQEDDVLSADHAGRYRPIFTINRTGWWLHSKSEGQTILASAN